MVLRVRCVGLFALLAAPLLAASLLAGCEHREAVLLAPHVDPDGEYTPTVGGTTRPGQRGPSSAPVRFAPESATQREMRDYIREARAQGRADDALHVLEALATRPPMSHLRVAAAREWIDALEAAGRVSEADAIRAMLRDEAPPVGWLRAHDARKAQAAGRVSEAEQAWRAAVRLDRHDLAAWLGLTELLVANGRDSDAREALLGYERAVSDLGLRLAQRHSPEEKLAWLGALDVDIADPRVWHAVGRALDDPHPAVVREALRQLSLRAGVEVLAGLRARRAAGVASEVEDDWDRALDAIQSRAGARPLPGRRRPR